MGEPFSCTRNGKLRLLSSCTQMQPDPRNTVLSLVSIGFAARGRIHGNLWISHFYAGWCSQPASWIRERIPFVFLGVKNCLVFLTFPYPVPVPKNCVIFIGCNFKSRASQVGLHKQKKDILHEQRRKKWAYILEEDKDSRLCSRSNGTRIGLGRLKILSRWPSRATY